MQSSNPTRRKLSIVIFIAGVLLALALGIGVAWADMESTSFAPTVADRASEALEPFSCPLLMTRDEVAHVRTSLTNRSDRPRAMTLSAHISRGFVSITDDQEERVTLEPGETREFEWDVTAGGAVWGRVVLVRVFAQRSFSVPPRTASCGILVIGVPLLPGSVVLALTLLGSLFGTIGGTLLWIRSGPLQGTALHIAYALGALTVIVVADLILSLVGLWAAAIGLTAISVLLIVSVSTWALSQ